MGAPNGLIVTGLAVALLTAAPGTAGARSPEEAAPQAEARKHTSRELLEQTRRPEPETSWLSDHISLHRKSGLQYRSSFRVGERDIHFQVRGPVHKNLHRKQFGLKFEIRF